MRVSGSTSHILLEAMIAGLVQGVEVQIVLGGDIEGKAFLDVIVASLAVV